MKSKTHVDLFSQLLSIVFQCLRKMKIFVAFLHATSKYRGWILWHFDSSFDPQQQSWYMFQIYFQRICVFRKKLKLLQKVVTVCENINAYAKNDRHWRRPLRHSATGVWGADTSMLPPELSIQLTKLQEGGKWGPWWFPWPPLPHYGVSCPPFSFPARWRSQCQVLEGCEEAAFFRPNEGVQ